MGSVRESRGFPLSVAVRSDMGLVRANNEDSYEHGWLGDESLLVVVADGMGGHDGGEVASGLAVRVIKEVVGADLQNDPRERMYNALLEANEAIIDEGRRSGIRDMGTTAIVGLISGIDAHVALVGDSRLFHVRRGKLLWRTHDHTRVQMLVDQQIISEEESRNHPESGMLTRALGHSRMADGRPLEPDVLAEPLQLERRDALVLSSDGLHDLVEDWEIAQAVAGRSCDEAAELLVRMACERGGHDNVTVAVVVAGEHAGEYDPEYVPTASATFENPSDTTYNGVSEDSEAMPPKPGSKLLIGLVLGGGGLLLVGGALVLVVAAWALDLLPVW